MEVVRTRGFSATWLKYLACISMLVDHATFLFYLPMSPAVGAGASIFDLLSMLGGNYFSYGPPYYLLRGLGRLAFPIFAFFVAEGCRKTGNFPAYLKRLFLFMLLTQIPVMLAMGPRSGTIMLTFFLASAGIFLYRQALAHVPAPVAALPILPLAFLAHWLRSDYGAIAVLLIFALYLCGDNRVAWAACLTVGLYLYYRDAYFLFASVSTLLLFFYDGRRGSGNKWFFYWFYPAHLMILYLVRCLTWMFW